MGRTSIMLFFCKWLDGWVIISHEKLWDVITYTDTHLEIFVVQSHDINVNCVQKRTCYEGGIWDAFCEFK